ncbi:DUF1045 domain-containing protein [Pararhizobium sp.]|uniref:DUF1045 domain-containing protein n=1 Tax=Pararhizobium sp. TaxID=1977563 RepID=UPI00271E8AE2|nr:DUF1045 domain-containing protein [Pararhizobium sp.]MDO9414913.1 DUF1045 domain-containing protein [Pararhizobium sp.]
MRYAICFTPPVHDPLSIAAAAWLGRNVYSGDPVEPPVACNLAKQDLAYHTAMPRRYGFHAGLKVAFGINPETNETALLKALMRFSGTVAPFQIPALEIARLGDFYGLVPSAPSEAMNFLAASVVHEFDRFRSPLSDAEIERRDPDGLTAPQFANLHRWGHPYVMDEFRFHMTLTGPVGPKDAPRIEKALRETFDAALDKPVSVSNLALFVEEERGSPFRVHSLHPLGKVAARKIA